MQITNEKLEELYRRQRDVMYNCIYNKTKDKHRTEEIVQETFLRLRMKDYSHFNDDNHVEAWLMMQCKALMENRIWNFKTKPRDDEDYYLTNVLLVDESPNPLDNLINQDNLNELRSVYNKLKPKYLRALHLFYFNEMKLNDIAKEMGTTQKMVSFMISKGRKILRSFLPAR